MKCKIEIRQNTKDELKKYGIKDSTYDEIICGLLMHAATCDMYWNSDENNQ